MSETSKPVTGGNGENPDSMGAGVSNSDEVRDGIYHDTDNLLERIVEINNMMIAYRKVVGNKGETLGC